MSERKLHVMVGGSLPRLMDRKYVDEAVDDPQWQALSAACARGDREAMLRFARWFESQSTDPKDDRQKTANFWEYRYHYLKGDADRWLRDWFEAHPKADALRVMLAPNLRGAYCGGVLRYAGFPGWDDYAIYEIHGAGEGILAVDELVREDRDEDGFGWESEYDRRLCDENLRPFPGLPTFCVYGDEVQDIKGYIEAHGRALELLKGPVREAARASGKKRALERARRLTAGPITPQPKKRRGRKKKRG